MPGFAQQGWVPTPGIRVIASNGESQLMLKLRGFEEPCWRSEKVVYWETLSSRSIFLNSSADLKGFEISSTTPA